MALACLAWAFEAIWQVFLYWAVAPPGGSDFFFEFSKSVRGILKLPHLATFVLFRISLVLPSTPNSEKGGSLP